jgi:hypothetical protein
MVERNDLRKWKRLGRVSVVCDVALLHDASLPRTVPHHMR